MTSPLRILLLAVTLLLAAAAPANAATPLEMKTAEAVKVANATWGTSHCPNGVTHTWIKDADRPRDEAGNLIVAETSPAWVTMLGDCNVNLYRPNAKTYMASAEWWCELIVHEYGHAVAGIADEDPRWPIMTSRIRLGSFKSCFAAERRYWKARERIARAARRAKRS